MTEAKVYEFSKHIGALCVTRHTNADELAAKLKVDPTELLRMINGRITPTKTVISGLERELDSDISHRTKLAAEIKPG